jgi:membrane protein YqaA with SNARE-associated domain
MKEFLIDYGLVSMFFLSFFASSFIPIASEWLLVVLIVNGLNPIAVLFTATLGNYLGACTTYGIGLWGSEFLIKKVLRLSDESKEKAEKFYKKYGVYSLLFSWLPIIGDPLCVIAGMLKVKFIRFSILVYSGKFVRYAITTYLVTIGKYYIENN